MHKFTFTIGFISGLCGFAYTLPILSAPLFHQQAAASQSPAVSRELTNEDVLSMVRAGLSPEVVLAKISSSPCKFDTSPGALGNLKKAGAPDAVILAMVKAPGQTSGATALSPAATQPLVKSGQEDDCNFHPIQSKCRRFAAQFLQDGFAKSSSDVRVAVTGDDATTIVFTSQALFKDKRKRVAFRGQWMGTDLEKNLCTFGFRLMVLSGSDQRTSNEDEYEVSCPKMPEPLVTPSATPEATAQQVPTDAGTGRIRGILTFFFNDNYGNRPDTGSGVWLIRGNVEIPSTSFFLGLSDAVVVDKAHYSSVAHTVADGNGSFDLVDVPVGDYTLVIQSNHTKGAHGLGKAAVTMRDIGGRVIVFPARLGAGQTVDKSWDFGISSF